MASFEVKLRDGSVEVVEGADAYQPDGPFTTFFAFEQGRTTVDCWSVRVASIRSGEIVAVWRRHEPPLLAGVAVVGTAAGAGRPRRTVSPG